MLEQQVKRFKLCVKIFPDNSHVVKSARIKRQTWKFSRITETPRDLEAAVCWPKITF